MATNGESARQWLEDNQNKISESRVKQIRDSLDQKANDLSNAEQNDSEEEYQGVLEALDVMETFINEHYNHTPVSENEPTVLDYSPLGTNTDSEAPLLNQQEKKARFQDLLKSQKL